MRQGECNKNMVGRLKKHITRQRIDDDDPDDLEFNEEDVIPTDESTWPEMGRITKHIWKQLNNN